MKYSVWNRSTKSYDVYDCQFPAMARIPDGSMSGPGHVLGFPPIDEIGILPGESKYLGSSDEAQGQVVFSKSNIVNFFTTIIAVVLSGWIYDKFIKG